VVPISAMTINMSFGAVPGGWSANRKLSRNGLQRPRGSERIVGHSEVVLLIAKEQAVCSGRPKRKRDAFLPLLEHAIAYLHEFRVRFNVGLQIL
jgi:hypothetical protein